MAELKTTTNGPTENKRGFFVKLANGDFGLAKTFWLYGILVSIVVKLISEAVTSIGGLVILILAFMAYNIPLLMGIWRAANKYHGPKIWAVLAKIEVWLWTAGLVLGLLEVIGLLSMSLSQG